MLKYFPSLIIKIYTYYVSVINKWLGLLCLLNTFYHI